MRFWAQSWQALVTSNGRVPFRRKYFLEASAVGFYNDNPSLIAVGTVQNGIFVSSDHGFTWAKVPGSEAIPHITAFAWRSATDVIVSSYGRGLWRMPLPASLPGLTLPQYCSAADCSVVPLSRSARSNGQYNHAVLAFGGRIQGARVANGVLKEVFVRPGTSVATVSDSTNPPEIKITDEEKGWLSRHESEGQCAEEQAAHNRPDARRQWHAGRRTVHKDAPFHADR